MRFSSAAVAVCAARAVTAIWVAQGSSCSSNCGNVLNSITPADVACLDTDFPSLSAGIVLNQCLTCESTSAYEYTPSGQATQSDVQWMLYNMRYTLGECLFTNTTSLGNNPCITSTACGPLRDAILTDGLSSNTSEFDYCNSWLEVQVPKCSACLNAMGSINILNNFLAVLDGGCQWKPPAGITLNIKGSIFSKTSTVSVSSPTPTSSYVPPASPGGVLGINGIVGVVIGGVVALLIIAGCIIVLNGKRRRRAYLRRREQRMRDWPTPQAGGDMFETPVSQRPLRGWEDSPTSAATEKPFPQYYSPYSSQYNSPISAVEGPSNMAWPVEKTRNIGIALSPDTSESNHYWGDKKGKDKLEMEMDREAYEMQEGVTSGGGTRDMVPQHDVPEAPVLSHPGYGRQGGSPERREGPPQPRRASPSRYDPTLPDLI